MYLSKRAILLSTILSGSVAGLMGCGNSKTSDVEAYSDPVLDVTPEPKAASGFTEGLNQALKDDLSTNMSADAALSAYNEMSCSYEYNIPYGPTLSGDDCLTLGDAGPYDEIYWNREGYNFLDTLDNPFDPAQGSYSEYRINPSLLRMGKLNNAGGLDDIGLSADTNSGEIYQVRGLDLAVMSFVKTENGWIIIDPLTSEPTARKAYEIFRKNVIGGEMPIKAIIFTHSHIDHFGGVAGLIPEGCGIPLAEYFSSDTGCDGNPKETTLIYAPEGFFEHSVSENVMAGNIMSRRATYMYGNLVEPGPEGAVDGGLGKVTSSGAPSIIEAIEVSQDMLDNDAEYKDGLNIDGKTLHFQMANGSEAPSEFMFYIEEYNLLMAAEVVTNTIHNISSMRGARTRDANAWVGYIDQVLERFGNDSTIMIASHHWPTYGQVNISNQLEKARDMYKYVHDQALRLANMGYTPTEISKTVGLPESLDNEWYNRGYYGTVSHNARATYDFYLGAWWDGNPANLDPMTPAEEGIRYVVSVGGIDKLQESAEAAITKGEYRWAARLLNHGVFGYTESTILEYNDNATETVVYDESKLQTIRYLAANVMEQLGYQAESGPWRNYYLGAAKELRVPVDSPADDRYPHVDAVDTSGIVSNMPTSMALESLALRVNPMGDSTNPASIDDKKVLVTFDVSDAEGAWYGEYYLKLSNSVLKVYQNPNNNEIAGGETAADSDYRIPGSTNGYTRITVSGSIQDIGNWIGEVSMNGGCASPELSLPCQDGGEDFKNFSAIFDVYPVEFGIATP